MQVNLQIQRKRLKNDPTSIGVGVISRDFHFCRDAGLRKSGRLSSERNSEVIMNFASAVKISGEVSCVYS